MFATNGVNSRTSDRRDENAFTKGFASQRTLTQPGQKMVAASHNSLSNALLKMPNPNFESNTQIRAIMTNYQKKRMILRKKSQLAASTLPQSPLRRQIQILSEPKYAISKTQLQVAKDVVDVCGPLANKPSQAFLGPQITTHGNQI